MPSPVCDALDAEIRAYREKGRGIFRKIAQSINPNLKSIVSFHQTLLNSRPNPHQTDNHDWRDLIKVLAVCAVTTREKKGDIASTITIKNLSTKAMESLGITNHNFVNQLRQLAVNYPNSHFLEKICSLPPNTFVKVGNLTNERFQSLFTTYLTTSANSQDLTNNERVNINDLCDYMAAADNGAQYDWAAIDDTWKKAMQSKAEAGNSLKASLEGKKIKLPTTPSMAALPIAESGPTRKSGP